MATDSARLDGVQRRFSFASLTFLIAGLLLGTASLSLAVRYGWDRGTDEQTRLIWGAVGFAAGLAALAAPGEALSAVRSRQWARAMLCGLLFFTAASWTVAGALGSASAGRTMAAEAAARGGSAHARLLREHARLEAELTTIGATRPAAAIAAEITATFMRTPGLTECRDHDPNWRPTKTHREACKLIARLEVERATAQRRADVDAKLARAARALDGAAIAAPGNADATALATYARALGLDVTVDRMGDLLTIAAVLVVDLAGGLALALGRPSAAASAPVATARRPAQRFVASGTAVPVATAVPNALEPTLRASGMATRAASARRLPARQDGPQLARVKLEIAQLARSGCLPSSQRAICAAVHSSKGTVGLAITELLAEGVVVGTVGKAGTLLLPPPGTARE